MSTSPTVMLCLLFSRTRNLYCQSYTRLIIRKGEKINMSLTMKLCTLKSPLFIQNMHVLFCFFLIAATAKSEINLVHLNLKRLYIRTPDDAAQKSNTRLAEGNPLLPGTNETKRSEEKMLLHRHRHRLLCCGGGVATAPGRFAGDAIADHQQAAAGVRTRRPRRPRGSCRGRRWRP